MTSSSEAISSLDKLRSLKITLFITIELRVIATTESSRATVLPLLLFSIKISFCTNLYQLSECQRPLRFVSNRSGENIRKYVEKKELFFIFCYTANLSHPQPLNKRLRHNPHILSVIPFPFASCLRSAISCLITEKSEAFINLNLKVIKSIF